MQTFTLQTDFHVVTAVLTSLAACGIPVTLPRFSLAPIWVAYQVTAAACALLVTVIVSFCDHTAIRLPAGRAARRRCPSQRNARRCRPRGGTAAGVQGCSRQWRWDENPTRAAGAEPPSKILDRRIMITTRPPPPPSTSPPPSTRNLTYNLGSRDELSDETQLQQFLANRRPRRILLNYCTLYTY